MYIVVLPNYSPRSLSKAHDAKSVENTDTKSSSNNSFKKKRELEKDLSAAMEKFKEEKSEQTNN